MTVFFVDGPDGVGKTGYSQWLSAETGIPRLEMRPIDDTDDIEAKSQVFNAAIRDLDDQGVDLVIDRGSTSSIVYSRVFGRGVPTHAWDALDAIEPEILYLRCDAEELAIRYGNHDALFDRDEIVEIAETYDSVMQEVHAETGATVHEVDTTVDVSGDISAIAYNAVNKSGDTE